MSSYIERINICGGKIQSVVIIYRGNTCLEELLSLLSSLIKRRLTGGKITQNSVIILREETYVEG